MEDKVKFFKALSDTNRLRILKMLQTNPLCVCEITNVLELATSTVSQHLKILKEAGFIIEEKDGKWVNYLINPRPNDLNDYSMNGSTISYDANAGVYNVDPDGNGTASTFQISNPNFNYKSLRDTAVLRWEGGKLFPVLFYILFGLMIKLTTTTPEVFHSEGIGRIY